MCVSVRLLSLSYFMKKTPTAQTADNATRQAKPLKLSGNKIVVQLDENGEAIWDKPEELVEGYTKGFEE
jgi:hypothetical protein